MESALQEEVTMSKIDNTSLLQHTLSTVIVPNESILIITATTGAYDKRIVLPMGIDIGKKMWKPHTNETKYIKSALEPIVNFTYSIAICADNNQTNNFNIVTLLWWSNEIKSIKSAHLLSENADW